MIVYIYILMYIAEDSTGKNYLFSKKVLRVYIICFLFKTKLFFVFKEGRYMY